MVPLVCELISKRRVSCAFMWMELIFHVVTLNKSSFVFNLQDIFTSLTTKQALNMKAWLNISLYTV